MNRPTCFSSSAASESAKFFSRSVNPGRPYRSWKRPCNGLGPGCFCLNRLTVRQGGPPMIARSFPRLASFQRKLHVPGLCRSWFRPSLISKVMTSIPLMGFFRHSFALSPAKRWTITPFEVSSLLLLCRFHGKSWFICGSSSSWPRMKFQILSGVSGNRDPHHFLVFSVGSSNVSRWLVLFSISMCSISVIRARAWSFRTTGHPDLNQHSMFPSRGCFTTHPARDQVMVYPNSTKPRRGTIGSTGPSDKRVPFTGFW